MPFTFLQQQYNETKHKKRNVISSKKTHISEAGKQLLLHILTRSFQRQGMESHECSLTKQVRRELHATASEHKATVSLSPPRASFKTTISNSQLSRFYCKT